MEEYFKKADEIGLEKHLDEVAEQKHLEKLISKVPGIKQFSKWFNEISLTEFEILWKNRKVKNKISALIRHPGGLHEWLMCSRANTFKKWGVTMEEIKLLRTKIEDVIFKNPPGYHGGPGSTKAHNEILDLIDRSNSYDEFKIKLIKWSENRLEGGSSSLPKGL